MSKRCGIGHRSGNCDGHGRVVSPRNCRCWTCIHAGLFALSSWKLYAFPRRQAQGETNSLNYVASVVKPSGILFPLADVDGVLTYPAMVIHSEVGHVGRSWKILHDMRYYLWINFFFFFFCRRNPVCPGSLGESFLSLRFKCFRVCVLDSKCRNTSVSVLAKKNVGHQNNNNKNTKRSLLFFCGQFIG